MTVKSGDGAREYSKAREAHRARQALAKALQRDHVGDSHMTAAELEEHQRGLREQARARHPEWFS